MSLIDPTAEKLIWASPNVKFNDYFANLQPGLFMEFGVASGGSIAEIAKNTKETVWGFDSFEGLPEDWSSANPKGQFKCAPPHNIAPNVKLVVGLFQNTLPKFLKSHIDQVAFAHIDCDLYSSTKFVLTCLKDRLDGAVVVFDEIVGDPKYIEHEYKAFVEFVAETGYKWDCLGRWDALPRAGFRFYKG